ncbi:MAG: Gfo/Idh/MocA family oxidoreductase, partial [Vallitaleaceae bacterium]|nr:Gfo/Idh/MocA family oxidoreductase [Vallitaleaceae bacterium]
MKIALTGLNGYGGNFIQELLASKDPQEQLVAVVSQHPEKSPLYSKLKAKGIRIYPSLESCLNFEDLDLILITTPMHIHEKEVRLALEHGVSVYCEKPLAPTAETCRRLASLAVQKKCLLAVGFQWSYSDGLLSLKEDLLKGRYGKILSMKTLVLWNRPRTYFSQSKWKGKLNDENAQPLNECIISNAAAHFLHNLLFLAGKNLDEAAEPYGIKSDCYRSHPIETFDTISLQIETKEGLSLFFAGTLSAKETQPPRFEIHCEKAVITFPEGPDSKIVARNHRGEEIDYSSPEENRFSHYRKVLRALSEGTLLPCTAKTAIPHMQVVD